MKLFDYRCMRRNYEVKEITENQDIVLQWREFDHKQERLEAERAEQRPPRGLRLLVMDLDGTLTNDEKRILPETKAALMRLQREGVRLVLASGRPTPGIMPLARELQLDRFGGFILSFNGGMVIDAQTGAVLHC
ncbi:MAG: HAD hydrolase family protein, partial [Bacteroidaceae bacterium]|nr:HAD hydrolase family protein [Bacteroidaceae bacterium]